MNQAKLQAVLDMFEAGYPIQLVTSCQSWDDLTCDEQMIIESNVFES